MRVMLSIRTIALLGILSVSASCSNDLEKDNDPSPEISELKPFALMEPADTAVNVVTQTVFTWQSAGVDVSYRLVVSRSMDLSDPVLEVNDIKETTYSLSQPLLPEKTYYWTVYVHKGTDTESQQSQNGVHSFITLSGEPLPSPLISKYHVSPDGQDEMDRGSLERPFRTIAYAARRIPGSEGDTLFIHPGSYTENQAIIVRPGIHLIGSRTSEVTISSTGVPIMEGMENSDEFLVDRYASSLIQVVTTGAPVSGNQELANFVLNGMNRSLKAGIWVENRHNVTLHDIDFIDIKLRGAVIAGPDKDWFTAPDYYLEGITVRNCSFRNTGSDLANYTTGNLNLGQLDGAQIHDISIFDASGYGIKFMWDGYFLNSKFYNITTELSETDRLWGEDIGIELWNLGPGNEVYNISANTWLSLVNHPYVFQNKSALPNLLLHDVQIVDGNGNSTKEGLEIGLPHAEIFDCYIENKAIGMAIWNMGRENVTVRNNIFRNENPLTNFSGGVGIYIDNSRVWQLKDINIFNNVIAGHITGIRVTGKNLDNIEIKNNLFTNNRDFEIKVEAGSVAFGHNYLHTPDGGRVWRNTGTMEFYDNPIGDAAISGSGNYWDTYYRPTLGSPLIDMGEQVGLQFMGAAPDIGYYELQ